jgi:hypothetical protein
MSSVEMYAGDKDLLAVVPWFAAKKSVLFDALASVASDQATNWMAHTNCIAALKKLGAEKSVLETNLKSYEGQEKKHRLVISELK